MHERICVDPSIRDGQACVLGTRIPVHQVVRMLANGDTVEDLMAEYPPLERADILACLDYSAALAEEHVPPREQLADIVHAEEDRFPVFAVSPGAAPITLEDVRELEDEGR